MAKLIILRWTKVMNKKSNNPKDHYFESNLIRLNSSADIQVQLPDRDVEISYLLSISGDRFVSIFHDYFAELHIKPIPVKGHGQIMKFRTNKLPEYSVVIGNDIEDAGDVNPDDPSDITNGFAGSEGEYFRGKDLEILVGKNS